MRSLDCSRDVPFAENTRQFVDEETYDAVVLIPIPYRLESEMGTDIAPT